MSRKRRAIEGGGPSVPAYIVTFSDMVTLLLTFFVMLLSLAKMQDPALVDKGRDSFIRSIRNLGLGALVGKKDKPDFGSTKIKYFISKPDKLLEGRVIDAKEEDIRRIFKDLSRSVKSLPSQIVAKKTNFSVTNIRFPPGDATLNEAARQFLTKFCLDLQQGPDSQTVKLYVLGLAGDETTAKKQWIFSARRAQSAANFLKGILPSASRWPIYSWGAGPGGNWVAENSPLSKQSQVLIAVLRTTD